MKGRDALRGRGAWLAACALAVYLAATAVWTGYDRRSVRETFPSGSVYSSGDNGLSLAYGYLRAKAARISPRGRVAVLRRRIDAETLPHRAVVFRVQPGGAPSPDPSPAPSPTPRPEREWGTPAQPKKEEKKEEKKEANGEKGGGSPLPFGAGGGGRTGEGPGEGALLTASEESWVRAGGRLVLAIDGGYGPLNVELIKEKNPPRKVFPVWPGVSRFTPAERRSLAGPGLAAAQTVLLAGARPIGALQAIGAGEVILLSCPEIFHNRLLGKADHLALLETLAGLAEGRAVFFDERSHGLGEDGGVIEALGAWGLGPLLLLGLLAAAAGFWRAATRLGPPDREDKDTRSDAVELVDSLADLYDRALSRGDAVRLYHESFLHTVAAETGLRGPALEARSKEILEGAGDGRGHFEPDQLDRALRTLNEAFRRLQDAKRK